MPSSSFKQLTCQICSVIGAAPFSRTQCIRGEKVGSITGTSQQCFGAAGMSLGDAIKQIQATHLSDLQWH